MSLAVRSFLELVRTKAGNLLVLRFVTGNQLADMDSVVSSIIYAYFYHKRFPKNQPYLPLVNIPRDELRLRRDIEVHLNSYGISEKHLFFLEDLEQFLDSNSNHVELVLVDHCNLQGKELLNLQKENRIKVTGIIDHHADEGVFPDANPRIIHSNGSCSSMVFNYWTSEHLDLALPEVVRLLLGPLLIDTSNMTQKVEEEDVKAFNAYKKVLRFDFQSAEMDGLVYDTLYARLKKAKKDLEGYSFYDVLRKDYKQFAFADSKRTVHIGFSSLGKSVKWILGKYSSGEIARTFDEISKNFGLDIIVITTSYTKKENDEYTREFCYSYKDSAFEKLASFADVLELNDEIYGGEKVKKDIAAVRDHRPFQVYNQVNIKASRKQVVPAVKDIVESGKL